MDENIGMTTNMAGYPMNNRPSTNDEPIQPLSSPQMPAAGLPPTQPTAAQPPVIADFGARGQSLDAGPAVTGL